MNGHSANIAAWPAALTAHIFFGPKRSTSLPIGSAARKAAIAGEGQAETDLGGGQPHDLGEEHRRAGHEGALTEGEQQ